MSSKINYASATVAAELAKAKRAQNPQHKEKTSTKPTPKYSGWVKAEGPTQKSSISTWVEAVRLALFETTHRDQSTQTDPLDLIIPNEAGPSGLAIPVRL